MSAGRFVYIIRDQNLRNVQAFFDKAMAERALALVNDVSQGSAVSATIDAVAVFDQPSTGLQFPPGVRGQFRDPREFMTGGAIASSVQYDKAS